MRSNADVAPSASAQVVRGAVAASMVAFGGSFFARQIAPIGHALRRADPPAVRSSCPYRVSRARPAWSSIPCVRSTLSSHSTPCLGLASAPAWGWRRRLTLHLRWINLGATPTPALRVFSRFVGGSEANPVNHLSPSFGHDPSFPMVRKCLGGLRCGRVFRVKICLPRLRSATPSTHCRPSGLRKRQQTFPNRASSELQKKTAVPLAQLRAPLPPSCSYFTSWLQPPVPLAVAGIKRCPRHSRRFRTPIVVCAAWSFLRDRLTPAPSSGKSSYRLFFQKQTFPNSNPATSSS